MESLEVLKLVEAGFTADEIRQMMNPHENNPQNPQAFTQEPEPEKEPDPAPVQETVLAPANDQLNDPKFDQLNETMNRLIKTIQASNLHNNSIQNLSDTDINTQVDNIMAGIIRPEHEKKGE